jgi:hypothetical protein
VVAGIPHGHVTVIITVCLLATTLMMRSLSDTLLVPGSIWCWMFRRLTSASRFVTALGLVVLVGILTALTDITLTGIALAGILLLSERRIICLQLFVLAGVDTPLTPSADMRRQSLAY